MAAKSRRHGTMAADAAINAIPTTRYATLVAGTATANAIVTTATRVGNAKMNGATAALPTVPPLPAPALCL